MKKLVTLMIIFVAIVFIAAPYAMSASANDISIYINSEKVQAEVAAQIVNNQTVVPVRLVSEQLGAKVTWIESQRKVSIVQRWKTIEMYIDSHEVSVNGKLTKLNTPPLIIGNSTMLPFRFIGEQLGAKVRWNEATRSVYLDLPKPVVQETPVEAVEPVKSESVDKPVEVDAPIVRRSTSTVVITNKDKENANELEEQVPGSAPIVETDQGSYEYPYRNEAGNAILEQVSYKDGALQIQFSDTVEPEFMLLHSPHRIVITIPRTIHGANVLFAQDVGKDHVLAVRVGQFKQSPSTMRVVMDMAQKADFQAQWDEYKYILTIKPTEPKIRIVLDAGHGGKDPGAIGIQGRTEKTFNLQLTHLINDLLIADTRFTSVLTRYVDTYLTLQERVDIAHQARADLFVSIHANSFTSTSMRGTETFYTHANSSDFARIIQRHLLEATGFPDRGAKQKRFFVTRETSMPSALIEVGFLSNPIEEALLFDPDFQLRVAQSIVAAIYEFAQAKNML